MICSRREFANTIIPRRRRVTILPAKSRGEAEAAMTRPWTQELAGQDAFARHVLQLKEVLESGDRTAMQAGRPPAAPARPRPAAQTPRPPRPSAPAPTRAARSLRGPSPQPPKRRQPASEGQHTRNESIILSPSRDSLVTCSDAPLRLKKKNEFTVRYSTSQRVSTFVHCKSRGVGTSGRRDAYSNVICCTSYA